jgi:hypothetical protein
MAILGDNRDGEAQTQEEDVKSGDSRVDTSAAAPAISVRTDNRTGETLRVFRSSADLVVRGHMLVIKYP